MNADRKKFLKSYSIELDAKSKRIRQLIGSTHWGHDGRHKESILIDALRPHLPAGIEIATGFLVCPNNHNLVSREQDIVIYENVESAPVFKTDGLVIIEAKSVIGVISVKTKFGKKEIVDSTKTLLTAKEVFNAACLNRGLWCGAFFFDKGSKTNQNIYNSIANSIVENASVPGPNTDKNQGPNVFCLNRKKIFYCDYSDPDPTKGILGKIEGFRSKDLSFTLFLRDILMAISIFRDTQFDNNLGGTDPFTTFISIDPSQFPIQPKCFQSKQKHPQKKI